MSVDLAPQFTKRTYFWTAWKAVAAVKGAQHQFDDDGTVYTIWFYDGPEAHICTIWKGSSPNGMIETGDYTQAQNDSDKADFEANFKPTANKPLVPKNSDGRPRTTHEKPLVSRANFYSHDWTDPTTWYPGSVYVSSETATDSGNHLTYTMAHANVIDTYHGKVTQEDTLKDAQGHSYRVAVTVNGTAVVEQDPHPASGGDYTIDYVHGKITFLVARNPADVVLTTYHWSDLSHANGSASMFKVVPNAGSKLTLNQAECQFSTDVDPKDSILFEVWGVADFFLSSAQMAGLGIPAGIGYKIMLQRFVYKSFSDFQNDAFKAYPTYPIMGNPANWRAQPQPVTVFDWDYVASVSIQSTKGMEMRTYLQHDCPFAGWMATVTFYCTSEPDV